MASDEDEIDYLGIDVRSDNEDVNSGKVAQLYSNVTDKTIIGVDGYKGKESKRE